MNRLYQEISEKLLNAFSDYLKGKISLGELKEIENEENLIRNFKNWKKIKETLKIQISENLRKLYDELQEINKNLKSLENMNRGEKREIKMGKIISHAGILGRNKMPPVGFHNSNWYVGPYPNIQMLSALGVKWDEGE